jgi:tripartite-type tricarboxylate transporter receptor subunit TctC
LKAGNLGEIHNAFQRFFCRRDGRTWANVGAAVLAFLGSGGNKGAVGQQRLSMLRVSKFAWAILAAALAVLAPTAGHAQQWPQRTVKFVVPLGPASGVDIGARLFADRLSARWGQAVVVENRPGGDGMVAINAFLGAADDHTLLFAPTSAFTAHPFLYDKLSYDPRDFIPVARVSNTLIAMAVPASLNVASMQELVALIRAQPGKLNWAGITGAVDLVLTGFLKGANLDIVKVPYRDGVQAVNDLSEGRVQMYTAALAISRPHFQAGKVKLIAILNHERAPTVPDVPTMTELGYPAASFDGLVGVFAIKSTSAELRAKIAADIKAVGADPVIADRLLVTGQLLRPTGPDEFSAAVDEQRARVAEAAKRLGLKPAQ